jgi:hypothetical protein
MTDTLNEFCKMLLTSTKSLEEKIDELWNLPDEDLDLLMKKFKAEEGYEICQVIKTVLDEKKLDKNINPDEFQFSGLE